MTSHNRQTSPKLVSNPFIQKRNLEWNISPPPLKRRLLSSAGTGNPGSAEGDKESPAGDGKKQPLPDTSETERRPLPSESAAIESGDVKTDDHLGHFTALLSRHALDPFPPNQPRLPIASYASLYTSALGSPRGAHFVIHQHDHPVAGAHYDLRLQINGASSASWAVMYGPPGAPNGLRPMRNATETRVHCLWNHLVETAGADTGSLLVWDTGTYEVLPLDAGRRRRRSRRSYASGGEPTDSDGANLSDDEMPIEAADSSSGEAETQQQKLHAAFQARKIRIALHGTRLPRRYVINLRLTKKEDAQGRAKALRSAAAAGNGRQRRRRGRAAPPSAPVETSSSSGSESDSGSSDDDLVPDPAASAGAEGRGGGGGDRSGAALSAAEREIRELEDAEVRRTNAYPGAENTIGSVHQRRWFLSLDRLASGLLRRRRRDGKVAWEPDGEEEEEEGDSDSGRLRYPFYVRGPDLERSVVTGRLGSDILRDEGVVDFVGRKGWKAVLK